MSKTIKMNLFLVATGLVILLIAQSLEAKSLNKGEVYRSWDGRNVIEVISKNEVEMTKRTDIILGQYTFKNSKLRIVFTLFGTKIIEYYELTQEGLKDKNGVLLYSISAFAKAKQKAKEAQKKKELLAKLARERENQKAQIKERQAAEIAAAAKIAKMATRTIGEYRYIASYEGTVRRRSILGTITLTDAGIELTGEQPHGSHKRSNRAFLDAFAVASKVVIFRAKELQNNKLPKLMLS